MGALLKTSTHFAAASAEGADWRACVKQVLDALESVKTAGWQPGVGFVYVTQPLAGDLPGILSLLKTVTGIETWNGSAAAGICGAGKRYIDVPAISVMIGTLPPEQILPFRVDAQDLGAQVEAAALEWAQQKMPMLILLHGDSSPESSPNFCVAETARQLGGFLVGGLSSSNPCAHVGAQVQGSGFDGLLFSAGVPVATCLSQGCLPITGPLRITRCEGPVVQALDGKPPLDVFSSALRELMIKVTGQDPDNLMLGAGEPLPGGFEDVLNGDIHVAFPVKGSDMKDFMVRNMVGIDPDTGYLLLTQQVREGDSILFVKRNRATVRAELSSVLVDLRRRVQAEHGIFAPKGALYISCAARMDSDEMGLINEIIGDVPLTGFFAGGEIHGNRLYTYTGVLILFL